MEDQVKSEGRCVYCNKQYSKRGISRHLETHLKTLAKEAKSKKEKVIPTYHVRVEAWNFFLQLLVNGNKPLIDLDTFLRQIWLECCGHMSQFSIGRYQEITMGNLNKQFMRKGFKFNYIYDWGSSTELELKVINEHLLPMEASIQLLSRNEFLKMPCDACQKRPAEYFCHAHDWGEPSHFCEECSENHETTCEEAEYSMVNLVNSPRSGVCGYNGGTIDTARDTLTA